MELRHLRYFVTVADEKHITRAALRLGMHQPPLSKQIRQLEDEVGARLFRRTPWGVELTDVGTGFFDDAQAILQDVDRALTRAKRVARGETGRIIVGMTSSATFYPLVQQVIRRYREMAPDVSLELREMASAEQIEALVADELDVGFVRTSVPKDRGITVNPLIEEPMLAALPEGHHLGLPERGPLPLEALASEAFVLYRRSTGAGLYDSIIAACNAVGFAPRTEQEAPWVGATLSLVAAGLGVTIVPSTFHRLQLEGVVYRPLMAKPNLTARISLAFRGARLSAASDAFIKLVRRHAKGQDDLSERPSKARR
ncbi:MAG: LysR family transcriptional regulator [Pseudomonadota bacterium]